MKRLIYLLVSGLLAVSVQAMAHDEEAASDQRFFSLLRFSHADQSPLTAAQMQEKSSVIVRGYVQSVTPGRELYHVDDLPNTPPLQTAIIELDVSRVIKGEAADKVYFEYVVGGMPAEVLHESRYRGEVLLFLRDNVWSEQYYTIVDQPGRVMSDVPLYSLTRDSGFFIQDLAVPALQQPLKDEGEHDFETPATSFDTLEQELGVAPHIPDRLRTQMDAAAGRGD